MAAIAATGMFDGVHCGHRAILNALTANARGRQAIAFTFRRHPIEILTRNPATLITDLDSRIRLIRQAGITPVVLDFDRKDLALTAREYLSFIGKRFGVEAIVMGYNNHIGSDRRDASWIAGNLPIEIHTVAPCTQGDEAPSSSAIRQAIADSDIPAARRMLGHPFSITGKVTEGQHIGRTIGFPTANITPLEPRQILPPDGVYAVDIHIGDSTYRGMANIGTRPTLDDGRGRTFEVNIFNFDGNLYGHTITVDILSHLRPERAFNNLDDLKAQLHRDKDIIQALPE